LSRRILAKRDGQTLAEHTIDCFKFAEALVDTLPFDSTELARIRGDLLQALAYHDAGKAASGFQLALTGEGGLWGRRHEAISAAFASGRCAEEAVVFAVLTHHKTIPGTRDTSCVPREEIPFPGDMRQVWLDMEAEWMENFECFMGEWRQICASAGISVDPTMLSPLALSRSWVGQSQNQDIPFDRRRYASLLRGLVITCDHIASGAGAGFQPVKVPDFGSVDFGFRELYAFQRRAGEYHGNLILRAPTGSGKTLAALHWARRNQKRNGRLFYVLPNQASINAMHKRLSERFPKESVGLLHSRAASSLYSMMEMDGDSSATRQRMARGASGLARELWYPVKVCTPYQILRYMLHGKGWELMLAEFPNGLFVFDEIHAYEPIVTGLVVATAKCVHDWGASCIFLSATMPAFLQRILQEEVPKVGFIEPSPDEATDREILSKKRHNLTFRDGNILDSIEYISSRIERSSSTLIVCNHVPTAQKVFEALRGSGDVRLLHSRFNREDRNRKEAGLDKLPKVLVSTQVVEVSLDVDFEQMYSEPAPVDALVQRLGRVNRRGSRPPADVIIFKEKALDRPPYDSELVERSICRLEKLSNPVSEADLVEAADAVYGDGYSGNDLKKFRDALSHRLIMDPERSWVAGAHEEWIESLIEKSEGSLEVLPESLYPEYKRRLDVGLTIEANMLLVPIRRGGLSYLHEYIIPGNSNRPWIIKKPYSSERGLFLSGGDG